MSNPLSIMLILFQLGVDPSFVSLSTPLEYRYSGGGYDDELFKYRLFCPSQSDPPRKYPLIVWLHGACEGNRDNIAQLQWLDQFVFRPPWNKGQHSFYLLAVQCPRDNFIWAKRAAASQDDMVNVAAAILEQTIHDYPIDLNRVYLSGVSSGGTGCWEFAIRHPEYFAAIAPMASSGSGDSSPERLINTPIWAFHCSRDSATPIGLVRATVQRVADAAGTVHLTEVDSTKHDCWSAAFNDYHLLDWLLSQQRSHASPAPGTVPFRSRLQDLAAQWHWWQVVAQIAIPTVLLTVGLRTVKHRRRRQSYAGSSRAPATPPE